MSRTEDVGEARTPQDSLLVLPVTPQQLQLLAPAIDALQAARERVNLVFSGILAAHGHSAGSLVSLEGGERPTVTIRVGSVGGTE